MISNTNFEHSLLAWKRQRVTWTHCENIGKARSGRLEILEFKLGSLGLEAVNSASIRPMHSVTQQRAILFAPGIGIAAAEQATKEWMAERKFEQSW